MPSHAPAHARPSVTRLGNLLGFFFAGGLMFLLAAAGQPFPLAVVAPRQAAWAGTHEAAFHLAEYGGETTTTRRLIVSASTPPVFARWSETELRITEISATRSESALPGESAIYRASALSDWSDSVQRRSRNRIIQAFFSADYTQLTLHYRNAEFDGLLRRTFRLDESSTPLRVVGDDATIYTKLP